MVVVCLSGVRNKDSLRHAILQLGGEHSPHLTADVDTLVAHTAASDKCVVAALLHIPLVTEQWLLASLDAHAFLSTVPYSLPVFANLNICVTGIDLDSRLLIQSLVTENGGFYSADLTRACSLLVAEAPSGVKYDFAVKWGSVKIVKKDWIFDSIANGACLNPAHYSFTSSSSDLLTHATQDSSSRNITFLDNCNIYISPDFSSPQQIRRIIRDAGGSLPKSFDNFTTHYLIKDKLSDTDLKVLKSKSHNAVVVKEKWLLVCAEKNEKVSIEPYLVCVDEKVEKVAAKLVIRKDRVKQTFDIVNFNDGISDSRVVRPSTPAVAVIENSVLVEKEPEKQTENAVEEVEEIKNETAEFIATSQLFQNLNFSGVGYTSKETQILEDAIKKNGGTFYRNPSVLPKSGYVIVPLQRSRDPFLKYEGDFKVVTHCWIECCLDDQKIHNLDTRIYFQPLKTATLPIPNFENFVICITGFDGIERTHINKLTKLLGADFTETFSRKCTHLVCRQSLNPSMKMKKAGEWDIPKVTEHWLTACAETGSVVNVDDYLFKSEDKRFNVSGITETIKTPAPRKVQIDSPLDERFTKNLSATMARIKSASSFSVKSEQLDGDLSVVLSGVVICTSTRLLHLESEIHATAERLGAQVLMSYSDKCTHYIHQSKRVNETFRDFKVAKSKGKFIVSPSWLFQCEKLGRRVNELDFPHTYVEAKRSSSVIPEKIDTLEVFAEEITTVEEINPEIHEMCQEIDKLVADTTSLEKKPKRRSRLATRESAPEMQPEFGRLIMGVSLIDHLSQSTTVTSVESEKRVEIAYDNPEEAEERDILLMQVQSKRRKSSSTEKTTELPPLPSTKSPRKRQVSGEKHKLEEPSTTTTTQKKKKKNSKYVFVCTGLTPPEKLAIAKIVKKLGGTWVDANGWLKSCTHLVMNSPNKTEKCLAACAAGAWMILPSYIYACEKAGAFINEEEYEWRAKKEGDEFHVARSWRIYLGNYLNNGPKRGVFDGWIVALVMDKAGQIQRVLEAGGAKVTVPEGNPFPLPENTFTHCVVEKTYLKDAEGERSRGVIVQDIQQVATILVQGPVPNQT